MKNINNTNTANKSKNTAKLALVILPVIFALTSCNGGTNGLNIPQPVIYGNVETSANTNEATNTPNTTNTTKTTKEATKTLDVGNQAKGAQEAAIFAQINKVRGEARKCGDTFYPAAPAVTWNGYLARAARLHANDMASRAYFGHRSPEGKTMRDRVPAAGYTGWEELGENLAAGLGVDNVMAGWLASPSHCATLMDADLKEVGVGFVERAGSPFQTYWVQNFGTR